MTFEEDLQVIGYSEVETIARQRLNEDVTERLVKLEKSKVKKPRPTRGEDGEVDEMEAGSYTCTVHVQRALDGGNVSKKTLYWWEVVKVMLER
jgi:hypothetical protein